MFSSRFILSGLACSFTCSSHWSCCRQPRYRRVAKRSQSAKRRIHRTQLVTTSQYQPKNSASDGSQGEIKIAMAAIPSMALIRIRCLNFFFGKTGGTAICLKTSVLKAPCPSMRCRHTERQAEQQQRKNKRRGVHTKGLILATTAQCATTPASPNRLWPRSLPSNDLGYRPPCANSDSLEI